MTEKQIAALLYIFSLLLIGISFVIIARGMIAIEEMYYD